MLVEAADGARRNAWRCLADCAARLRGCDSYLLAIDSSHRLWPEVIEVLRAACPGVRTWLPRNAFRKIALLASFGGSRVDGGESPELPVERLQRCEAAAAQMGARGDRRVGQPYKEPPGGVETLRTQAIG